MSDDIELGPQGDAARLATTIIDHQIDRLEERQRLSIQTGLRYSGGGSAVLIAQQKERQTRIDVLLEERSQMVDQLRSHVRRDSWSSAERFFVPQAASNAESSAQQL